MIFKKKLQAGKLAVALPVAIVLSVMAGPLLYGAPDGRLYQFLAYVIDMASECKTCPPQSILVSNIMNAQKDGPSVLAIKVDSIPHIGKLVAGAQYRFYVRVYPASNSLELIYYETANNQQPLNDYVAQKINFSEFLQRLAEGFN